MRIITFAVSLSLSFSALAADTGTVVDTLEDGETNRISILGNWGHMATSGEDRDDAAIVDLDKGIMYAIDHENKTIMEIPLKQKGKANSKPAKFKLKKKGKGPEISGYATDEYELTAAGQSCGRWMLSSKLGENADIKKLFSAIANFNPESMMPEGMAEMMGGMQDPCESAEDRSIGAMLKLGFPMQSTTAAGDKMRVTAFKTGVNIDPRLFKLPDYKRTSVKEMQQEAASQMQDAMKQMQEMFKGMSPEEQKAMQNMMGRPGR